MGYVKAAADNVLFLVLRDEGFLCALPMPHQPGVYMIFTEAGDQGGLEENYSYRTYFKSKP